MQESSFTTKHTCISFTFFKTIIFYTGIVYLIANCFIAPPFVCAKNDITLTAVGDIMPGTNFPSQEYMPPAEHLNLFKNAIPFLKKSDIVFANLEGAILNDGECIKVCKSEDSCFAFRIPELFLPVIKNAGFNLLSLANNHISDFGTLGKNNTVNLLSQEKIHHAGLSEVPLTLFKINALTIGFAAFAPNIGTVDIRDLVSAKAIVSYLASKADIVIISFHGGAEGIEHRNVTRGTELYYGEDRGNVYEFSHLMIDAGADVVLGHGPHIVRSLELYKERLIAYSLGNFCTYSRFNLLGHKGVAPILTLTLSPKGVFKKGKIIPFFQEHKKAPLYDASKTAIKEFIELMHQDFPETRLQIDNDTGIITKI